MNKEKLLYEAPTALTFEVRCEGCILNGSLRASSSSQFDDDAEYSDGSAENWW